jgi:hypothetical protein
MKRNEASRKRIQDLCTEPGPEDGIDPRETLRRSAGRKGGRKTLQLCGQVAEALNYAFAGACNDDVLRELTVVAVQPAPDEARLLVTVGPALPDPCDVAEVTAPFAPAFFRSGAGADRHHGPVADPSRPGAALFRKKSMIREQ